MAYGQIPRAARSHKHQRAAAWIEALGRPEDQAEMLAYHYLQALELAEAAGTDPAVLGDSARRALRDAGDRAAALYAGDAAERFYDAALRLWPIDDPGTTTAALPSRGSRSHSGGRRPWASGRGEGCAAHSRRQSQSRRGGVPSLGNLRMQGRRDLADQHAERAIALSAGLPPSRSTAGS